MGFDQNLGRQDSAGSPVQTTRTDTFSHARQLLRLAAGRARARLLRLSDALHPDAQQPCEHHPASCRKRRVRDFEIVTVSFDPRETRNWRGRKRRATSSGTGKPDIAGGWHFLTGEQPPSRAHQQAAGFRYVWDEAAQQYAIPTGIVVLTPYGRVARYLYGIEYGPRDLRLAILDATPAK